MIVNKVDVVIIGAGASGLMCAATAGYRGKSVLVLDHANKAGKKILMSGGGRCNFTNMDASPKHFLSSNAHFCISALRRYSPQDFVDLVDRHGLEYVEKTPGQLFCEHSAKDLLAILLTECEWAGVTIQLNTNIEQVEDIPTDTNSEQDSLHSVKRIHTSNGIIECDSLVIATGGLSIPTMGATGFGYKVAEQFGLTVLPTRAGLVPLTLQPSDKERFAELSGVSSDVTASFNDTHFTEPMLFTHRGLSGPAILQISNFWTPGHPIFINLIPQQDIKAQLIQLRQDSPKATLEKWLTKQLPKRLVQVLVEENEWQGSFSELSNAKIDRISEQLSNWIIKPNGTEGYRTAEVTLGGVDTEFVSSKTFEAKNVPGLYFIGEVLDVTGWLGGYNFQWAWASGYAAGQFV
ncbi:NAD(P)/FAD-dependent oxidoreductase [Marinomonas sp. 15G1-11]|uniref:NAD(P)/FAD-dependent oxidoreductase n=1 Tax=Marinomonas phaeophyticola TaxID=3004091 RepID=A0ABT4JVC2_9GAMM|nr:NAD(P)/FAD-dependent oxidoreductase [Marinomonas sp. 15G1-11]MCZ2722317.1 NAD(P)/FAD-dependent oxidoreductase [Marinomonas sp. 15G1-11]